MSRLNSEIKYNLIFLDVDGVLNVDKDHKRMSEATSYWVRDSFVENLAHILLNTDHTRIVLSSMWRLEKHLTLKVKEEIAKVLKRLKFSYEGRYTEEDFSSNPCVRDASPMTLYPDIVISLTPDLREPVDEEELEMAYQLKPLPENWHQTRTDEILLWLRENAVMKNEYSDNAKNRTGETSAHKVSDAVHGVVATEDWLLEEKINVRNFICIDDMNLHYYSCYRLKAKIKDHMILTRTTTGLKLKIAVEAARSLNEDTFDIDAWAEEVFVPCDKASCFHKKVVKRKTQIMQMKERAKSNLLAKTAAPLRTNTMPPSVLARGSHQSISAQRELSGYNFVL